jgi:hypothetical protein
MQNLVVVMVDIANNLKVPSLILLYPCLHCINLPLTDQCDDGETTSYNLSIMHAEFNKKTSCWESSTPNELQATIKFVRFFTGRVSSDKMF